MTCLLFALKVQPLWFRAISSQIPQSAYEARGRRRAQSTADPAISVFPDAGVRLRVEVLTGISILYFDESLSVQEDARKVGKFHKGPTSDASLH